MILVKDVNLFEDKQLAMAMNRWTLPLLVVLVPIFFWVATCLTTFR